MPPQVLEQWGVEEDEVVEEVVASTERAGSDEEDDEIDLPSSKVSFDAMPSIKLSSASMCHLYRPLSRSRVILSGRRRLRR